MITVNCPKCGAAADMDEKREESIVCKHCKTVITLEKAAPEKYKELIEAREKTEQRYKNILKEYESGNDSLLKNAMHKVISRTDTEDFNTNRWFDFIFDAVNIAIKKKDTTNIEILKAHARRFDDAFSDYNENDRRLYDSLVFLHPEILSDSEWKVEFEKASADKADIQLLQNNILKCVKEKNEPKLLISVLNVLSESQEEFKYIGEEFLNNILDDEDIAKILSVSFFKKARGGNFAKKLKKYVSSTFKEAEVILKDTLVWNNAEKVQNQRKKQKIIIVSSVLTIAAAAVLVFMLIKNSIVTSSVELKKPSGNSAIIKIVYGESPDLTGYTVEYKEMDGDAKSVQVTSDMLSGYDKEKMGNQNAKITFRKKTFDVNIEIVAKQLEKTAASISDNKLIWDRVANAAGYHIYLTKSSASQGEQKYATVEDATGNAALVFDLSGIDNMGTEFYASVVAYSNTEKYSDSERSDFITVKKLAAPSNIVFDNGKIKWDAVEGADHYTLQIGAETIRNINTNEQAVTLSLGDNSITVTAFPSAQDIVMSVKTANIHKLAPVQSVAYSKGKVTWTAGSGASLYNVYCNGSPVEGYNGGTAIDVSTWAAGVYTIKVEVASSSASTVTSEPVEQKVYVGAAVTVSAGRVDWSALGGASYNVYVNGALHSEATIEQSKNIADLISAAGSYDIYVVMGGDTVSETITLTKLHAPAVSIVNQVLTVTNNMSSCEFGVDGVKFDGAYGDILATLDTPKEYVITAVNKAENELQIDSDTVSVTVRRLATPTVKVEGGELYVNNEKFDGQNASVKLYSDKMGEIRNPSLITDGDHVIYAQIVATAPNEINSFNSDSITATKLSRPVLTYAKESKTLTCSATPSNATLTYYNKGVPGFNPDSISSLTGANSITAQFMANGTNVLNSEISNTVEIVISNISVRLERNGTTVKAILENGEAGIKFDVKFIWYTSESSETPVGDVPKSGEFTGTSAFVTTSVASLYKKVVAIVTIQGSEETKEATWVPTPVA